MPHVHAICIYCTHPCHYSSTCLPSFPLPIPFDLSSLVNSTSASRFHFPFLQTGHSLLWVCSISLKGTQGFSLCKHIPVGVPKERKRAKMESSGSGFACFTETILERGLECSSFQPGEVGEEAPCAFHVLPCGRSLLLLC